MITKKFSEAQFWDDMYKGSSRRFPFPRPHLLRSHFELDRLFKAWFPHTPGLKLLEIGCGDSVWLPYFNREFGYEVYGIDYSEAGCQLARQNLAAVGATGTIFCQDMFNLEQDFDGQYDIVISFGVIEHFSQPDQVINIYRRLLKKKGFLFTYIPNLQSVGAKILKVVDRDFYNTHLMIDMATLQGYHLDSGLNINYATYLQFLDLSILGLTMWPKWLSKALMRSLKVLDLGPLYFLKLTGLKPQNFLFCSFMAVMVQKP